MKAVVASVKREWWGKMLAGEKSFLFFMFSYMKKCKLGCTN